MYLYFVQKNIELRWTLTTFGTFIPWILPDFKTKEEMIGENKKQLFNLSAFSHNFEIESHVQ